MGTNPARTPVSAASARRRPRILHLHSSFAAGGKELRAARLMNALGPGVHHAVVSAQPGAFGARVALDPGLDVDFPADFPALQGKPLPLRLWRIAQAMRGYDLVLTYNWGAMDAVMARALYARVLGLPALVHHEDGFNEDEAGGLKPARNRFRRLALRGAARLVVPSQRLANIAREAWRCPEDKLALIGNGIALDVYGALPDPALAQAALGGLVKAPGVRWVGTLAGLRAVKNLPRMVRAFAALGPEWQLVIVGDGPERDAIVAEAVRLGLEGRVFLPGFVARPSDVVGLFDIFALSSDSEQFPISVVEAMAAGLAIVAPAVGDVATMVAGPNAPFITPAGDDAALARGLARLAHDAPLRERVGAANREKAFAHFDEAGMIAAYRKVYGEAGGAPAMDPGEFT